MGKERSVILENISKPPLKAPCFNRCVQLSVNVESTNRAEICGLRRKNTVKNARYLRDGWKTNGPKRGCNLISALTNTIIGGSHG